MFESALQKRRNHSPQFKSKIALATFKNDKTLAELASEYGLHANQISQWKQELLNNVSAVFGKDKTALTTEGEVRKLHAKIGQLTMENDFLSKLLRFSRAQRQQSVHKESPLPITKPCQLLNLNRSMLYYHPDIFHTDQGSQFTCEDFTGIFAKTSTKISMDGKARRLWRSLKYEAVYLKAYDSVKEAHRGIEEYLLFHNRQRSHQSLDKQAPDEVYYRNQIAVA